MSKITCKVYPDRDYLDFNDSNIHEEKAIDLRINDDSRVYMISLDVKRMKKLRKQLKKYIKDIEEYGC